MSQDQGQPSLSPPTTTTSTITSTATTTTMPPPTPATPQSADLTHFLTHPWCAALLTHPTTTLLPTPSRIPKPSTEDSFFALTLRTGDTVPFMLSFSSPRAVDGGPDGAAADGKTIEQVSTLFALGEGVNGYPSTAHGGLIAALFDEAMGVSMMRLRASTANPKSVEGGGEGGGGDIVTARLTVDFLKMLATPGVVVVRVWVGERRGRRWVVEGEMVGGEGGGVGVGRARGVGVEVRGKL
ncbi:hypothetical protein VE03_00232 [Pseudogymnoascus sp. 23342-1-I1]|nr:hypothetical protein VE03_00232 [Pseudogymnoascus sp. 23342-1-I1]